MPMLDGGNQMMPMFVRTGGDVMRFEVEPSQDLGLRHVLRNGISVLQGSEPPQGRGRVLNGLLEIVSDAERGADALHAQNLTFALDNKPAFERFSLFVRYLSDTIADLPTRLAEARETLRRIEAGENVELEHVQHVSDLLSRLLNALERERALAPLPTMRDYNFQ